ncbi:MAG: hypothetical protein KBT29_02210 [Prevotellaceae bacterium]|nr:hypothetical protein [Candidatus Minthosoma caballi]
MKLIKFIVALTLTLLLPSVVHAQNISDIAKSDPLIITGAVGTQNTYHYSSVGDGYASPMSNSVYANLNINLYGISMPFAFYYTNDNLNYSHPQISFNISPTYKNWTGHLGQSSMDMSSYVMNMSWNGVGLEYNTDKFRVGAFYGRLRAAINPDPTDPFARTPQYKRMGWGFKAGFGSDKNYVDIYLLRAYDQLKSLDERWRESIAPQENIVVGVKGCVTPTPWLSFTANAATSAFSTNTTAESLPTSTQFDKIFDTKYSSLARFAGDANMNLSFSNFNTSISYRLVQPDYTSLGSYYMSNNYQSLGITASTNLFNRIALSGTFNGQSDNLTNKQMYTTRGFVYGANASSRIGNHFNIAIGYNGYLQRQDDGTVQVTDSSEVHRVMNSYSLTPSYSFDTDDFGHSISVSANYTENKDLNKFATGESDVKTTALGLSYGLNVKPWEMDFTGSLSHQQSKGYKTKYTSDVASLSTSRSFLEDKNLNVSATVSVIYNEVERQSKNMSIGCDFSASYTLKKVHVFSASAAFNKYGDVNITKTKSNLDCTDITMSLNYAYTFSLLSIKSKSTKEKEKQERMVSKM